MNVDVYMIHECLYKFIIDICVCACMHVCIYECMYSCIYVCKWADMYVYIYYIYI